MRVKETSRKEIEAKFDAMSDYVRIDYLTNCLKNHLDFDTRKFVLVKLAGLFEKKGMFYDAAKMMKSGAEINVSEQNKINDFVKAIELFVRAGHYDMIEVVLKKISQLASAEEMKEVGEKVKGFCRMQAKMSIQKSRRKQAIGAYEKLISFNLDEIEFEDVRKTLMDLYKQVGDDIGYGKLKNKRFGDLIK